MKALLGQMLRFGLVGASGYLVNIAIYALLLHLGSHYVLAATISFISAAVSNYILHRHWTFAEKQASLQSQASRFLVVTVLAYLANIAILHLLISAGHGKLISQALAIVLSVPVSFLGNKLWAFRKPALSPEGGPAERLGTSQDV